MHFTLKLWNAYIISNFTHIRYESSVEYCYSFLFKVTKTNRRGNRSYVKSDENYNGLKLRLTKINTDEVFADKVS